jgi:hypothetical protein
MESYLRIGGERFEKPYMPLHGGGQKLPKPSLHNEWLLSSSVN